MKKFKIPVIIAVFTLSIFSQFGLLAQTKNLSGMETFETKKIEVQGEIFTYRQYYNNKGKNPPLILFNHTRGNLDSWDPLFLNTLSTDRDVIVFNNKGVASSGGITPDNFKQMADDAYSFISALGFEKVDILGFSIGGCVAQEMLIEHPEIVRKAILAGTAPKGARSINERNPKIIEVVTAPILDENSFLLLFFSPTKNSQQLGKLFWKRKQSNPYPKDRDVNKESAKAQAIARANWGKDFLEEDTYAQISIPVLVANGKDDIMMPTENSVHLFKLFPNAQLNLYPDSGHGFLFQYPEQVATDFNHFLNAKN